MKATLSRDGQYRITMKVAFRLDLGTLANILASAYSGHSLEMEGPLPTLTQKATKEAIREQIENRGLNVDGWSDQFDTTETMDRFAWANEQVARAYPELAEVAPKSEPVEPAQAKPVTQVCAHGNAPRADVAGDPIAACAAGGGGTDWGAFNDEGCCYRYDCAVDVANESAKENADAEADEDDPASTWGEMCRDHDSQLKDACEYCFAEEDEN
jgi:hypothetical protein